MQYYGQDKKFSEEKTWSITPKATPNKPNTEGAKNLADALVKEDPDTGKASLNIPVPDKATIVNIFSSIATLLKQ